MRPLALDVVIKALGRVGQDGSSELDRMPSWLIDGVLGSDRLPRDPSVMLQTLLTADAEPDARAAAWTEARGLAKRLRVRPASSASLRKDVEAVAANPAWVEAVRRAVEGSTELTYPFAAVLVADGGEAAQRTLRAHLAADAWDLERALRRASPDSAVHVLIEELRVVREDAFERSPGGVLLRQLGLEAKRIHVVARYHCETRDAALELHVETDRNHPVGVFIVRCREGRAAETSFDTSTLHRDPLGIGRCDILEFPSWAAGVAEQLGLSWRLEPPLINPRPIRKALEAWLAGAVGRT